jgi:hypothetical protein
VGQKEAFKTFQQDDVFSTADFASNVVIKPEEEYAYGFIIEVLTSGLYPDVFHVVREYVQNSFDAIISWRRMIGDSQAGNVQITIDAPSIFVFDDGTERDRKRCESIAMLATQTNLWSLLLAFVELVSFQEFLLQRNSF